MELILILFANFLIGYYLGLKRGNKTLDEILKDIEKEKVK